MACFSGYEIRAHSVTISLMKDYIQILKEILVPDEMLESVEDIDLERLYTKGYRTILTDVDNTLLTYREKTLSLQKLNWLEKVQTLGFKVFLVSNNSNKKRIEKVAEQTECEGIYFSLKPFPFSVKHLAKKHYINLDKSIVIGDKLFTDIILGKWLKIYSILVDPLDKKDSFFRTLQKEIEKFVLNRLT